MEVTKTISSESLSVCESDMAHLAIYDLGIEFYFLGSRDECPESLCNSHGVCVGCVDHTCISCEIKSNRWAKMKYYWNQVHTCMSIFGVSGMN